MQDEMTLSSQQGDLRKEALNMDQGLGYLKGQLRCMRC